MCFSKRNSRWGGRSNRYLTKHITASSPSITVSLLCIFHTLSYSFMLFRTCSYFLKLVLTFQYIFILFILVHTFSYFSYFLYFIILYRILSCSFLLSLLYHTFSYSLSNFLDLLYSPCLLQTFKNNQNHSKTIKPIQNHSNTCFTLFHIVFALVPTVSH